MFTKDDFKNMRHNPLAVPQGRKMTDHYPALGRFKAFTDIPSLTGDSNNTARPHVLSASDLDTMVKFVTLMVEPRGNPIAREKNFEVRASESWRVLGISQTSVLRKFEQQGHWWFYATMFEYFKMTWDTTYQEWFSQKLAFHEMSRTLAKPMMMADMDDKEVRAKLAIAGALKGLRKNISELEATLFKDSETIEIISVQAFSDRLAEKYAIEYSMATHN